MEAQKASRKVESLKTTLLGNVYVSENSPVPFEVIRIEEAHDGTVWVDTEANNYEVPDWWDKRQSGVITRAA